MRLLHVFPSFEVGGQQMRAAVLANEMAKDGVHNLILPLNGVTDCADRLNPDVSFEILEAPAGKGLVGRLRSMKDLLSTLRPDRLITYNWGAIEWALANWFVRIPHIHIEDGFGPEEAAGQLRRRVLFRRLVLSRQSEMVFPSRTLMGLAADVWHLPKHRLHYVPNGLDLDPYETANQAEVRAAARRSLGLAGDAFVVGTLATLRPEKNLFRLIDAFEALGCEHSRLVIAGAGSERDALEARAREGGLAERVLFPGFVSEPAKILPAFDIFALSSDTEQMPLSVIEAMAAGLPVASTEVGDVKGMVTPEGADLVAGQSTEQLAASLGRLVGDPALRQRLGEANRDHAQATYALGTMVDAYRALYLG